MIESFASAFSLILVAIASLRAASRLGHRSANNGSIGLMPGPPILGPPSPLIKRDESTIPATSSSKEGDGERETCSPLWEHAEAFRHAVILGLIFGDNCDDPAANETSSILRIFSDISSHAGNVGSGSREDMDDPAFAAAIESGLLLPVREGGGIRSSSRNHRMRGGGEVVAADVTKNNSEHPSHPLSSLLSWFIRELSAPLAAIPTWHGLLCTYLSEQRESSQKESRWRSLSFLKRLCFLLTGLASNKCYDPQGMDFDASTSAVIRLPCADSLLSTREAARGSASNKSTNTRSVRVTAFAPRTFRDLRNNCFRVREFDFAQSILNAVGGGLAFQGSDITDEGKIVDGLSESRLFSLASDDVSRNHYPNNLQLLDAIFSKQLSRGVQIMPYISFQSNSKGAARAGTFFFFCADGAYMIKTVKKEEAKAFLEMLPEYHAYMSDHVNSRTSLLTRFFGMYSVRFLSDSQRENLVSQNDNRQAKTSRKVWNGGLFTEHRDDILNFSDDEYVYLVMNSVFPAEASAFVTERFDLKGSTVGRECSLDERKTKGTNAVFKDLDLKREVDAELTKLSHSDAKRRNGRKHSQIGIHIGSRNKAALVAQLERDTNFLEKCCVLDYSLLVGVADTEGNGSKRGNDVDKKLPKAIRHLFSWLDFPMPYYGAGTTKVDGGCLSSLRGTRKGKQVMYYFGVIDFLQPWTIKKRLERDLKGLAGYDVTAISCVAPRDYSTRFLKFIESYIT